MTYIQRSVNTESTLMRARTAPVQIRQPQPEPVVKKKPGLSYLVIEKGVVVSKSLQR